ncbi:MAG TPA: O-antigen ligase domain-containing protein [bacterium]|nr:O-antigen ligase domain-containing protein [bacterium]
MKNKPIFYTILAVEILAVVLAGAGILEKEAVLVMTGLLIFYFIFSKVEDSLILFIISIPLFIALPITDGFDTMANWRILLVVLFLCLFFKHELSIKLIKDKLGRIKIKEKFKHYPMEYSVIAFLAVAFLSLFVAFDIIAGIKKILFLVNIILLYIIIRNVLYWVKDRKEYFLRIIKAGAIAGIISLVVGYSQLISVFLTSLYNFWQWWARNVISVFYGIDLSKLLTVSNTWFSYYPDSPPTLRMFSVFPDSHSFALFTIISLIFFTYLLLKQNKKIYWLPIVLSFLVLLFSGSRGVWLSAIVPFLIVIFLFIRKFKPSIARIFISFLLIFIIAFPVSSFIMSTSQNVKDGALAFKRAKTLIDLEEISIKSRMEIWGKSFKSVLKKPLLGVGIGNYPIVLEEEISAAKRGASAHNLYLNIASEMGLLGLIFLLLIFWQIIKKSWKLAQKNQYALIFTFFFLWTIIYALFDVVLLNDKVLLLFMVVLGILYSKNHEFKLKKR